jgi:hypothetical protein
MDLEEFDKFDDEIEDRSSLEAQPVSAVRELQEVDALWYVDATRRSRWMDLLGDYAGSETFIIDGIASFLSAVRL